ncbi:hypothetical protein [Hanstruepera marina]|uniref:hypothetical protein n=1 Tax=Hanstruepera marina TaxID=2873265 RepID=UPI001CA6D4B2|nr:hypothetical protein [Hanstruepera marina]
MKLFYLAALFIITICFTACDGRDRLSMTPQEVLKENKLLDSFSEKQIRFIPEEYAEKTTDTIFDNGYKVHVKMYTDMENHITVDLNGEKVNYRDFNLDIEVIKDDKTILSTTLNKEHEIAKVEMENLELDQYYLRDYWITNDDKHHIGIPCIFFEYYSPAAKDSITIKLIANRTKYSKYSTEQIIN